MKTKFKKFSTPRENVRLLIQPRPPRFTTTAEEEIAAVEEENELSSVESPATPIDIPLSDPSSAPSNSSIVEPPREVQSKLGEETENLNNLGDGFRALLKVNDNCYEVDISDEIPGPVINQYPDEEDDEFEYKISGDEKRNANGKCTFARKRRRIGPSICLTNTRYAVVARVAKSLGWKVVRDADLWNIYWTDSVQGVDMYKDMKRFQKVNHFPGMIEVCRKDLLARNLIRMARLFPIDYNFFPKTWCFPADLGDAISYSRQFKNRTFILKPDTGAQGRGIWLTKNLKEIKPNERMICQVYINKPLLIDGFKFDLRVYTLVTSVDPLRVFVYNEGLARFATSKYKEPSGHNTSNVYMHLTNYSVNKHSRTFSKDDEVGSKRKFSTLNRILISEGFDVEKLWNGIDEIIVKTLLSALPVLKHHYHACFPCHDVVQACFEILGFDILVDSKMKPLLLEVNHSPSFHTDELIDREVKESLIRDTFQILNISVVDKKKILKEDKRRVQTRLLQRIRDNVKPTMAAPSTEGEQVNFDAQPSKIVLSPNSQQVAWEESHMGNYRRIMPAPNNPNKFTAFLILQNQASIYSETAASKRREEAAKQLRSELVQRTIKDQKYLAANAKKPSNENTSELAGAMGPEVKTKVKKPALKKRWPSNAINEIEERERVMLISQRDFLIRSSGIVQQIFENFYQNDMLSESDRKKFKDLHEKLETENRNLEPYFDYDETCEIHSRLKRNTSNAAFNDAYSAGQSRLPNIQKNSDYNQFENVLGNYISSVPIINPSFMLERLQRVRGKYSTLYRKTMPGDKFIS